MELERIFASMSCPINSKSFILVSSDLNLIEFNKISANVAIFHQHVMCLAKVFEPFLSPWLVSFSDHPVHSLCVFLGLNFCEISLNKEMYETKLNFCQLDSRALLRRN